jgi:hypothetical protein
VQKHAFVLCRVGTRRERECGGGRVALARREAEGEAAGKKSFSKTVDFSKEHKIHVPLVWCVVAHGLVC